MIPITCPSCGTVETEGRQSCSQCGGLLNPAQEPVLSDNYWLVGLLVVAPCTCFSGCAVAVNPLRDLDEIMPHVPPFLPIFLYASLFLPLFVFVLVGIRAVVNRMKKR